MLPNEEKDPIIGLLSNNQYKSAILDLSCLSFGFRIVPIPLNGRESLDDINFEELNSDSHSYIQYVP